MNLIDGKAVSASVKEQIRAEIERDKLDIGLAVIIVGNNQASRVYVNNKKKACEVCGIKSYEYALPEDTTQDELMELIDTLNKDDKVNGILCQLPLPKHLDEEKVIEAISPLKDVDAFNAVNVGKIMIGNYSFLPCTPAGVMELIHSTGVSVEGKECVVIGRSNIVGKPMAMLLLHENATVTVCHSRTKNLAEVCRRADILVSAVGRADFVTADMVKTMNKDAIIFAMANPVPEIMPDVAKAAGAKVVGTGRSDFPNQVNNVIAFPGIFKGALEGRARQITEDMKLAAALAIANLVPDDEVSDVNILPEAFDPRVADVVSKAVIDHIEK